MEQSSTRAPRDILPPFAIQMTIRREIKCYIQSIKLIPIDIKNHKSSIFATFIHAIILNLKYMLFFSNFLIINPTSLHEFFLKFVSVFLVILLYVYGSAFILRYLFKREDRPNYSAYASVILFSMTYLPFCTFLGVLLSPIGISFVLAGYLIQQFSILASLRRICRFVSQRGPFLVFLTIFITTFTFNLTLYLYFMHTMYN